MRDAAGRDAVGRRCFKNDMLQEVEITKEGKVLEEGDAAGIQDASGRRCSRKENWCMKDIWERNSERRNNGAS